MGFLYLKRFEFFENGPDLNRSFLFQSGREN